MNKLVWIGLACVAVAIYFFIDRRYLNPVSKETLNELKEKGYAQYLDLSPKGAYFWLVLGIILIGAGFYFQVK